MQECLVDWLGLILASLTYPQQKIINLHSQTLLVSSRLWVKAFPFQPSLLMSSSLRHRFDELLLRAWFMP
jgi:hypothetical protein